MDISDLTQELSALWGAASDKLPSDLGKLLTTAAALVPLGF